MDKRTNDQGPLEPGIEIGHVHLSVADLDRSIAFYKRVLGFEITYRTTPRRLSRCRIPRTDWIEHRRVAGWRGHRHLPVFGSVSRSARAGPSARPADSGRSVAGRRPRSRHAFEALYLRDPDGNSIELYYDRVLEAATEPLAAPRPLDVAALRVFADEQAASGPLSPPAIGPALKERLREVRSRLLDLHKVLLDDTKAAYELDRGRIPSNATLLQLVINDPWFAWLHPLSELVVRIDVALQPDGAATEADGVMLLEQVERLLSPAQSVEPFARRYYEALQRQPAVITAHGDVRRVLKRAK